MEYMLTFHILNVYVDKTQPRQFKFTFKVLCIAGLHLKIYIVAKLKNITPLKFLYVLGNMWMIKFQERSSKNHVIHKVNFMVIT